MIRYPLPSWKWVVDWCKSSIYAYLDNMAIVRLIKFCVVPEMFSEAECQKPARPDAHWKNSCWNWFLFNHNFIASDKSAFRDDDDTRWTHVTQSGVDMFSIFDGGWTCPSRHLIGKWKVHAYACHIVCQLNSYILKIDFCVFLICSYFDRRRSDRRGHNRKWVNRTNSSHSAFFAIQSIH